METMQHYGTVLKHDRQAIAIIKLTPLGDIKEILPGTFEPAALRAIELFAKRFTSPSPNNGNGKIAPLRMVA